MKDRLDKIKEKYRENWLEILLMIVFVCAALVLNVSQRTEETEEVFGSSVNKPEFLEQEISRKESEEEIADEETEEEMTGEETEEEMTDE
ncbi:MAG: hypothetical protein Q4C61_10250 [Lachnospiraceae bacterium]|nr:hypothetical protein [Lachnospiraceae bacterium]